MPRRRTLDELVAVAGDLARQCPAARKSPTGQPGRRHLKRWLGGAGVWVSEREAADLVEWLGTAPPMAGTDANWKVQTDQDDDGLHVNVKGQALVMCLDDLIRVARIDTTRHRVERHRVNT
jgi:hypothetical protein